MALGIMVVGGVKMEENKKKAMTDVTYYTSDECKEKCWRHVDDYTFEIDRYFSFIQECEKQRMKNARK